MTIKALLFDIGGVLYRCVDASHQRKWELCLGLPKGQLAELVFTNPVAQLETVVQATPEEVWQLEIYRPDLSMATFAIDFTKYKI